jgi:DNA end-binding protein Ku
MAATEAERGLETPAERTSEEQSRVPEVPYEDVVKGYEVEPGAFVMVRPEELEALRPTPDHVIEITDFVSMDQIDPIYFEKSYYVAPQAGAERPYALLLRAMERSNRVGIARFVLRTKEYLAAIRPMEDVIALETMFFADEIRAVSEIWNLPATAAVPDRELGVAGKLIDLLATDWEPNRYTDSYRERILELIRSKAETRELVEEQAPPARPGVPDLLAALRASVESARKEKTNRPSAKRRRTG